MSNNTGDYLFSVRLLSETDIDIIVRLEQTSWPGNLQATRQQLAERIRAFEASGIGVLIGGTELIACATCQVVKYQEGQSCEELARFFPKAGIAESHHSAIGNCLHLMSCGVHPDYRRRGFWKLLIAFRLALARSMQLKYVMVDSRLPGLRSWLCEGTNRTPSDYVHLREQGEHLDPFIRVFEASGFSLIGIADSGYTDPESCNKWGILIKPL